MTSNRFFYDVENEKKKRQQFEGLVLRSMGHPHRNGHLTEIPASRWFVATTFPSRVSHAFAAADGEVTSENEEELQEESSVVGCNLAAVSRCL